jgi:pSer/pThr/pTyr-binding forkhead associated (FHA) protein
MVQFRFLSGKMAGRTLKVSHFPWRIGRSPQVDCQLEDAGVWDRHAEVTLSPGAVFQVELQTGATGSLNGQSFQTAALRNGDTLDFGAAKIQFWLSETTPRDWRWRERLFWAFLSSIAVFQVFLIYCLS